MRHRLLTVITLVGFFAAVCPVYSQDKGVEGTISLTAKSYDVNGNKAKYFEYSDDDTFKARGKVDVLYDSPSYFIGLFAKDPGYDTQQYRLEGGAYGKFKYWIDYNEIIHNRTFDDNTKTFYSGAGSDRLTGTPNTDPNTWAHSFDYTTQRKRFGTGVDFVIPRPFFFNVSYLYEEKEGTRPIGVSTGTGGTFFGSVNAPSLELPAPVDYETNGFTVEGGYAKKPFFVSLVYSLTDFKNRSEDLFFTPVGTSSGILSLEPDNKFYQLAMKGAVDLPFNSRFSVNLGQGRSRSDADVFTQFHGKVDTSNYDFQLVSQPLGFLDARLFYKYHERDNRSNGGVSAGTVFTDTVALSYQANTYGVESGLQLPLKFHLNGGYKYVDTDRRVQSITDPALALPHNVDDIYTVDLKWSGLDFLTARVGYEYLDRSARYRNAASSANINRQFAYASQERDTFTAGVDISPLDTLNAGIEYQYKKSDYTKTAIGYTADKSQGVNLNADYAFRKLARLYGYFDYEKTKFDQRGIISFSPWESKQEERTYGYGLRSDIYVVPKKFTLILAYDYLHSNGNNDFEFFDNAIWSEIAVPVGSSPNIPAWDDYRKYSARITAVYRWSESISTKLGYAYERYDYSDAQINGYRYFVDGPGSSQAYLTGAYSRPSYSANIVFLSMSYKFQ